MDREKVIKALSICVPETQDDSKLECSDCPYGDVCNPNDSIGITLPLIWDIRELLKEQEAVVPYQHDAVWLCGNCGKEVVGWDDDIDGKEYRYPFCRQCGQAVKWE